VSFWKDVILGESARERADWLGESCIVDVTFSDGKRTSVKMTNYARADGTGDRVRQIVEEKTGRTDIDEIRVR
jgi:hypothetical protein